MNRLPNIPTTAALRLTGTKSEIELVLAILRGKDFFWKTNGKFYPQRGEGNQYAYYLNDLQLPQLGVAPPPNQVTPAAIAQGSNEPQPRPWDAVRSRQGSGLGRLKRERVTCGLRPKTRSSSLKVKVVDDCFRLSV